MANERRADLTADGGAPPGVVARLVGVARVVHPFPSLLDAAVVAAVATVAGAPPSLAATLAASMLALQLAIGAANDWADAPADALAQPDKPIPAGLVGRRAVARLAALLAATGLGLAAVAGLGAFAIAVVGLGVGLAYDLRLKGTRWSWLPYAIGIPLLPVFAWLGATGGLPAAFIVLVPLAAVAGTALAIANALADIERDRDAGVETVAAALGPERAGRIGGALMVVTAVAAVGSAVALGGEPPWTLLAAGGAILAVTGVVAGLRRGARARRRSWELQGCGAGLLAVGWLGAIAAAGRLAG